MELTRNTVLLIIVVCVFLFFFFSNKEGMTNTTSHYHPQSFQPRIAEQVRADGFIELNQTGEFPWSQNVGEYGAQAGEIDALEPIDESLSFNLCSKNCCSAQWPVPFSMQPDDFVLRSGEEFVPTSYKCNNGFQDSGCVCMTKKQSLFLNNRGNNAGGHHDL